MSKNIANVYAAIESEREAGREYVKCLRALADAYEAYNESLADGLAEDVRAYETAGTENATASANSVPVARQHYHLIMMDDAVKAALAEVRAASLLRHRALSLLP